VEVDKKKEDVVVVQIHGSIKERKKERITERLISCA
jgi:hypothetical protein